MRSLCALLLPILAVIAGPAAAQGGGPAGMPMASAAGNPGGDRLVGPAAAKKPLSLARYGPFRVLDGRAAALLGVTDAMSPRAFLRMLRDYPHIATIWMVECPGTLDDGANLRLGRMIRAKGIATHVPADGLVASGAVELFVAGVRRSAEPGARFAVHSWRDQLGRVPQDFPADAPQNRAYIDYYRAVGMSLPEAKAFYAMTNSVPFNGARWLTRAEMAKWVRLDKAVEAAPRLTQERAYSNGAGL